MLNNIFIHNIIRALHLNKIERAYLIIDTKKNNFINKLKE